MSNNFEKMLDLVTAFFDTKNDPDQISITEEDREKLLAIHPSTLSELANEDGPIVWILLIPTTKELMYRFISREISENQLLKDTPLGIEYDCVYLCSATVLTEFQGKGLAKKVALEALDTICQIHPIKHLFYWQFSEGGKALANSIAKQKGMELLERI